MDRQWIGSLAEKKQEMVSVRLGEQLVSLGMQELNLGDGEAFTGEKMADGLKIRVEGTVFPEYRAVQWVLWLENVGDTDTPQISDICAADVKMAAEEKEKIVYAGILGDSCSGDSFLPFEKPMPVGANYQVHPEGGRSSNAEFPYFDIQDETGGLIVAIGWSGQWQYTLSRETDKVSLQVGLEDACFYLKPGEKVRLPRVLLKAFEGDSVQGHNDFRALLRAHFTPKTPEDELITLPTAIQCFDRYSYTMPHWNTEEGQKEYADCAAKIGHMDTVWLDAAWFKGGFPWGVGNYEYREGFPRGLKPVSDHVHELGMQFMVWFEPERVTYKTQMYTEYRDWVICDPNLPELDGDAQYSGLLDLSRAEVVDFLIEKLSQLIRDNGIDIYRQDFNIDPLGYWRIKDEPERRGMTEILYINGFYRLWDTLRERFPGMRIDNCASGGRRIDLETCMRSAPLWRSDTGCSPLSDERPSDMWNQNQTLSLSRYLVFHSVASWNWDAYEFRSAATAGMASNFGVFDPEFDFAAAGECMKEFARLKKYWTGDFYGLTPATLDNTVWSAFQFHRKDLDAGVMMLFRRSDSPYETAVFSFAGVAAEGRYRLMISDEQRQITETEVSGRELLQGRRFILEKRRSSLAVEYTRI